MNKSAKITFEMIPVTLKITGSITVNDLSRYIPEKKRVKPTIRNNSSTPGRYLALLIRLTIKYTFKKMVFKHITRTYECLTNIFILSNSV
jgi:hypothetical protein